MTHFLSNVVHCCVANMTYKPTFFVFQNRCRYLVFAKYILNMNVSIGKVHLKRMLCCLKKPQITQEH